MSSQITFKIIAPLIVAIGGWAIPCAAQPVQWDKTVSVEVIAPDHKPDGKTWDLEIPVMFSIAMPTLGDPAPDMMLCVVDAAGAENCVHDARRNQSGVPLSICPNAYKCNFANVKVPSSGYFGFLVVDLDVLPSKQDYMLGAVIRNGGHANSTEAWKIEKALKAVIRRWNVYGAPDEFPESAAGECTTKDPCFGSSKGGIPSISIDVPEVRTCGMPIAGTLDFGPGESPGSVGFQFQPTVNECPGGMEYVWQFGDGATETTSQPRSAHSYSRAGVYTVKVVPRCIRKSSMCDAPAQSTQLTVGR